MDREQPSALPHRNATHIFMLSEGSVGARQLFAHGAEELLLQELALVELGDLPIDGRHRALHVGGVLVVVYAENKGGHTFRKDCDNQS